MLDLSGKNSKWTPKGFRKKASPISNVFPGMIEKDDRKLYMVYTLRTFLAGQVEKLSTLSTAYYGITYWDKRGWCGWLINNLQYCIIVLKTLHQQQKKACLVTSSVTFPSLIYRKILSWKYWTKMKSNYLTINLCATLVIQAEN